MADHMTCVDVFDWLAVVEPGCPMCEEISTVLAAIDVVIDGDQLASECSGCGRLVRPFSWHDGDGLPECYLGRFSRSGQATLLAAVYGAGGAVRLVPAVDPEHATAYIWPGVFSRSELARAVLAHLVGLDVPQVVWEEFEADMIGTLTVSLDGEWELLVEDITEWLAANR